jgi:LmbE family N-acetylglucosaminyl deacetylase
MRILAMGAHPDDLEIFAWGTLCAWRESGAELVLAVATDGARGGAATGLRETRQAEARRAAQALDLVPRFLDFPDGALIADRALDEALRRLIAETAPDLLVTHAPEDYHADHRALAAAALQAVNYTGAEQPVRILHVIFWQRVPPGICGYCLGNSCVRHVIKESMHKLCARRMPV